MISLKLILTIYFPANNMKDKGIDVDNCVLLYNWSTISSIFASFLQINLNIWNPFLLGSGLSVKLIIPLRITLFLSFTSVKILSLIASKSIRYGISTISMILFSLSILSLALYLRLKFLPNLLSFSTCAAGIAWNSSISLLLMISPPVGKSG